ncbi:uncharacterized protein LOC115083536 isoform X2 [Rhinatrema bivittatum]|uniref:uncharacterized protein LOC115083536 isoform X2 n=1 Tax=Rhinatrema bivittatum TaxID=194408 RepID=UPI00112C6154|nr:uncharacterized protein LOC115083536 isoform X2 [Rhinatrema bivittatum]
MKHFKKDRGESTAEQDSTVPVQQVITYQKPNEKLICKVHDKWVKWADADAFLAWPAGGSFQTSHLIQMLQFIRNKYKTKDKSLASHIQVHSWFILTKTYLESQNKLPVDVKIESNVENELPPCYASGLTLEPRKDILQPQSIKVLQPGSGFQSLPPTSVAPDPPITAVGYKSLYPDVSQVGKDGVKGTPCPAECPPRPSSVSGARIEGGEERAWFDIAGRVECRPVEPDCGLDEQVKGMKNFNVKHGQERSRHSINMPTKEDWDKIKEDQIAAQRIQLSDALELQQLEHQGEVLEHHLKSPMNTPITQMHLPAAPVASGAVPKISKSKPSKTHSMELRDRTAPAAVPLLQDSEKDFIGVTCAQREPLLPRDYVAREESSSFYVVPWVTHLNVWTSQLPPQMSTYPLEGDLTHEGMNAARSAIRGTPSPDWSHKLQSYMHTGLTVWEKYEGKYPSNGPLGVSESGKALSILIKQTSPVQPPMNVYSPWSFADLQTLLDKLPSILRGAGPWISEFEKHTSSYQLAVGDLKAVLAQTPGMKPTLVWTTAGRARVIDSNLYDGEGFNQHRAALWQSLRQLYPQQCDFTRLTAARWNPKFKTFDEHLHGFQTIYQQEMGEPFSSPNQLPMFSYMFVQSLPEKMRTPLLNVVGLESMDWPAMNSHFFHYLQKYEEEVAKPGDELVRLQAKLCSLQIANNGVSRSPATVANQGLPEGRNLHDLQHAMYVNAPLPGNDIPRSFQRGRGGPPRGRGYDRRRDDRSWDYAPDCPSPQRRKPQLQCWQCGNFGHLARECKERDVNHISRRGNSFGRFHESPQCQPGAIVALSSVQIGLSDSQVTLSINSQPVSFLVDMGAAYSVLQKLPLTVKLTQKTSAITGFSGVTTNMPFTQECQIRWCDQTQQGDFIYAPHCPVNLLGRDLLTKFQVQLQCGVFEEGPSSSLLVGIAAAAQSARDQMLSQLPPSLWSSADLGEVGLSKTAAAHCIRLKQKGTGPMQEQYRLPPEARPYIQKEIDMLIKEGVLENSISPFNSPLCPVKKKDGRWRMVQDLRALNDLTIPVFPNVANPVTLLHTTPIYDYKTTIDLAHALFCIPLQSESRPLTAFRFGSQAYQWTRLPQGYRDSSTLLSTQIGRDLAEFERQLPDSVTLLQYVDDILLTAQTETLALQYTHQLLQLLFDYGYKVNRKKLKIAQRTVTFLGNQLSPNSRMISSDIVKALVNKQVPETLTAVRSVLGLLNFCRLWIPGFSQRALFLYDHCKGPGKSPVSLTLDERQQLHQLIVDACTVPLHLYDHTMPIELWVTHGTDTWAAVGLQSGQTVMFLSGIFSRVEKGMTSCERDIVAAAVAREKTQHQIPYADVVLHSSHDIAFLLNSSQLMLTDSRIGKYKALLVSSNTTLKPWGKKVPPQVVVLQDILKAGIAKDHVCTTAEMKDELIILSTPIPEGSHWFVGAGGGLGTGTGFGAVRLDYEQDHVIQRESFKLPNEWSAQEAELCAVSWACTNHYMSVDNPDALKPALTVYTDSHYVYASIHHCRKKWKRRGMLSSTGTSLASLSMWERLFTVLAEYSEAQIPVSIVWVKAHQPPDASWQALGNYLADQAAGTAAGTNVLVTARAQASQQDWMQDQNEGSFTEAPPDVGDSWPEEEDFIHRRSPVQIIYDLQQQYTQDERQMWEMAGAILQPFPQDDCLLYIHPSGKPCLPIAAMHKLLPYLHLPAHAPATQLSQQLQEKWWAPQLSRVCHSYVQACTVCQTAIPCRGVKVQSGTIPKPMGPGLEWHCDFTDMGERVCRYRYLLVCVDAYSQWVEAFPCKKETVAQMAKALCTEIIPRFGFPTTIVTDNSSHFANNLMTSLIQNLQCHHRRVSMYRPTSNGLVERCNGLLQNRLRVLMMELKTSWLNCLPWALMYLRQAPSSKHNLSPHQISTGRPVPWKSLTDIVTPDRFPVYWANVLSALKYISSVLTAPKSPLKEKGKTTIKIGDLVWRTHFTHKTWKDPVYLGPFQVEAVTPTASKDFYIWCRDSDPGKP